jgi:hypothetical protein
MAHSAKLLFYIYDNPNQLLFAENVCKCYTMLKRDIRKERKFGETFTFFSRLLGKRMPSTADFLADTATHENWVKAMSRKMGPISNTKNANFM